MQTTRRRIYGAALGALAAGAALVFLTSRVPAQATASRLDIARQALNQVQELIAAGQVDPGWAQSLTGLSLSIRNVKGFAEHAVALRRTGGDPPVLTFYFNMAGEPTGDSLEEY